MSSKIPVAVPDIGDFEDVEVIEILVAVGDQVATEDPLITVESDKAAMDLPAPCAGTITEITVVVGDKVSENSIIATITTTDKPITEKPTSNSVAIDDPPSPIVTAAGSTAAEPVVVPDIGDFEDVEVIEILVRPGETVAADDPLVTLESDKATMDLPAPIGGCIDKILVAVGDKVSAGHIIAMLLPAAAHDSAAAQATDPTVVVANRERLSGDEAKSLPLPATSEIVGSSGSSKPYASPSIRKFARELGADLEQIPGSGRKGRIVKTDVQAFVKSVIKGARSPGPGSFALPPIAPVDFAKFGPVEVQPLSKIKRLTGQNLHRSWITAPHVTQFDEADITELETFRKSKRADAEQRGVKLTLLAFLIKAVVVVLSKYPEFNASLSSDGESIIFKQYFNIGIAVNTERGLMVPVIKNADQKGLYELAGEIRQLSAKARDKQLTPADMSGGCFTISNLGAVGGTVFTPIINVPEVAILGISPATMKPVYDNGEFVPRLMLPFALSYDHRVIDGVAGAQFTHHLGVVMSDIRHILL